MTQYPGPQSPHPWQQQSQPLSTPEYPPQQGYNQPLQPGYDGPPVPQQPPLSQPPVYPQPQAQMQQPYYGVPVQPIMQQNVNVNIQTKQTSFLVRILYFLFIGWWLGFFWLNLGYFLCLTVIGLPLGLVMLNRLPQVLTLRPAGTTTKVQVTSSASMVQGAIVMQQNVNITVGSTQQLNFLVRALYFIFIGSWLGYLWACTGYVLCLFIVTIPLGLVMLNRLPAVLTLRKN